MTAPVDQAVEAAVRKFMRLVDDCIHSPAHKEARECLEIALRATLARPLEVAAPVVDELDDWQISAIATEHTSIHDGVKLLDEIPFGRACIAASRAPVAVGVGVVVEPVNDPDRWCDAAMPPEIERRLQPWLTNGAALHPLTVNLLVRFARALAAKLSAAEVKYGYSDGWMRTDWMNECRANLMEHIAKGDPRDVAAYCAFLWHHGESTATPPVGAGGSVGAQSVPLGGGEPMSTDDYLEIERAFNAIPGVSHLIVRELMAVALAAVRKHGAASGERDVYNGADWEMLAMALAADENDDIHHLIWEGGPVPEPWGEVWQKYEDEAKRMISLVQQHVPATQPIQPQDAKDARPDSFHSDSGVCGGVRAPVFLKVCVFDATDPPFVYWCQGRVTAHVLAEMDKDFTKYREDLFTQGLGDYTLRATHQPGQYGEYGMCELAPGWEYDEIGFEPQPAAPTGEGA